MLIDRSLIPLTRTSSRFPNDERYVNPQLASDADSFRTDRASRVLPILVVKSTPMRALSSFMVTPFSL